MLIILGGTESHPPPPSADVAEADQPCERLRGGYDLCRIRPLLLKLNVHTNHLAMCSNAGFDLGGLEWGNSLFPPSS